MVKHLVFWIGLLVLLAAQAPVVAQLATEGYLGAGCQCYFKPLMSRLGYRLEWRDRNAPIFGTARYEIEVDNNPGFNSPFNRYTPTLHVDSGSCVTSEDGERTYCVLYWDADGTVHFQVEGVADNFANTQPRCWRIRRTSPGTTGWVNGACAIFGNPDTPTIDLRSPEPDWHSPDGSFAPRWHHLHNACETCLVISTDDGAPGTVYGPACYPYIPNVGTIMLDPEWGQNLYWRVEMTGPTGMRGWSDWRPFVNDAAVPCSPQVCEGDSTSGYKNHVHCCRREAPDLGEFRYYLRDYSHSQNFAGLDPPYHFHSPTLFEAERFAETAIFTGTGAGSNTTPAADRYAAGRFVDRVLFGGPTYARHGISVHAETTKMLELMAGYDGPPSLPDSTLRCGRRGLKSYVGLTRDPTNAEQRDNSDFFALYGSIGYYIPGTKGIDTTKSPSVIRHEICHAKDHCAESSSDNNNFQGCQDMICKILSESFADFCSAFHTWRDNNAANWWVIGPEIIFEGSSGYRDMCNPELKGHPRVANFSDPNWVNPTTCNQTSDPKCDPPSSQGPSTASGAS